VGLLVWDDIFLTASEETKLGQAGFNGVSPSHKFVKLRLLLRLTSVLAQKKSQKNSFPLYPSQLTNSNG